MTISQMKKYTVWSGQTMLWTTDCEELAELYLESFDHQDELYITEQLPVKEAN